jgi:K+-transporting ATPase KdpF subunit
VNVDHLIGLGLAGLLFAYLVFALVRPERF